MLLTNIVILTSLPSLHRIDIVGMYYVKSSITDITPIRIC